MRRPRHTPVVLAVLAAAGLAVSSCTADSTRDAAGPPDLAGYFSGHDADYDPVHTGAELAAQSDLVVTADLTALRVGPTEVIIMPDPEEDWRYPMILLEFDVTEVLEGGAEPDTVTVALPWVGGLAETPLGSGEDMDAHGRAVLYLSEFPQDYANPLVEKGTDADPWARPESVYSPSHPLGLVMEDDGGVIAILGQGYTTEIPLEEFYPDSGAYPELGHGS